MRRGSPELASAKGTRPDSVTAATEYSSVERINLRERLSDALESGTFSVTAIAHDLKSNTVQIRIESSAPAPASKPATPQPYVRHKLEPRSLPDTVVQVPTTVSAQGEILIRVAAQVNEDAGVLQGTSQQPVWPSHVILVKLDERPLVIPVLVPVQRVGTSPRSAYTAVFQVDARAAVKTSLTGSYQVYIDLGHSLLGPYGLTITP
jgi:hypothetical protein